MLEKTDKKNMSRRELLKGVVASSALVAMGAGFIAAPDAAWALEVSNISEHEMATLVQMARDTYPHDRIGDEYYVVAVKGYDNADQKDFVSAGVSALDEAAKASGAENYISIEAEEDRVAILKAMEDDDFFQTIRGGLVTGFYNQKEVWGFFGYEGESFSKGGYINRGFDDIDWL